MTEPLAPCPFRKNGRHSLGVIVPETSELPATLFCDACGMTKTVALTQLQADDVIAEVERIVNERS